MNSGQVYAVFDYEAQHADELSLKNGDSVVVLRKGDDNEREWWWSKLGHKEGYVPRNLLGVNTIDWSRSRLVSVRRKDQAKLRRLCFSCIPECSQRKRTKGLRVRRISDDYYSIRFAALSC